MALLECVDLGQPDLRDDPNTDADVLASDTPVQVQIYRQLRGEIIDGLWVGRADFPGDQDLADHRGGLLGLGW